MDFVMIPYRHDGESHTRLRHAAMAVINVHSIENETDAEAPGHAALAHA
jgi:hypothetical protein